MAEAPSALWWWLTTQNEKKGPVSHHELQHLYKTQVIHDTTYVWTSTLTNWLLYKDVTFTQKQPSVEDYTVDDMTFDDIGGLEVKKNQQQNKQKPLEKEVNQVKLQAALEREKEKQKENAEKNANKGWVNLAKTTCIYITGLPEDASVEEVQEYFEKCGIIRLDDENQPKIKLYTDPDTGKQKGDGLVNYLKLPSVDLACQILDGSQFRPGACTIKVTPAKFEMKGDHFQKKKPNKNKRKLKQQEESLDWGGFDDKQRVQDVTVILKHMFTLDEAEGNSNFFKELEEDITSECFQKCGEVIKVRPFVNNPEGVISVRFKFPEGAAKCVSVMEGRWFAGRQISADLYDGYTNYQVKRRRETEEEQKQRLEEFSKELESS